MEAPRQAATRSGAGPDGAGKALRGSGNGHGVVLERGCKHRQDRVPEPAEGCDGRADRCRVLERRDDVRDELRVGGSDCAERLDADCRVGIADERRERPAVDTGRRGQRPRGDQPVGGVP